MERNTIYTALLLGSTVLFAACANTGGDGSASDSTEVGLTEEIVIDGHHAANALDYFGTYAGQLPCVGCESESLAAEIVINADSTFLYTRSEEREGAESEVITGVWSIDRNTITLSEAGVSFHVAENRLIPIGEDGQRFTGELEERFSLHMQ